MLADMHHGEQREIRANDQSYKVWYHSQQSYGDDNHPVSGATTGAYTVEHPSGRVTNHHHGPHAGTPLARKAGANPNAKGMASSEAMSAIKHSATMATVQRLYGDN